MKSLAQRHPSRRQLERYLRNRLEPLDAASIEEHYLWCSDCVDRLEDIEGWRSAARCKYWVAALPPRLLQLLCSWDRPVAAVWSAARFAVVLSATAVLLLTTSTGLFHRVPARKAASAMRVSLPAKVETPIADQQPSPVPVRRVARKRVVRVYRTHNSQPPRPTRSFVPPLPRTLAAANDRALLLTDPPAPVRIEPTAKPPVVSLPAAPAYHRSWLRSLGAGLQAPFRWLHRS